MTPIHAGLHDDGGNADAGNGDPPGDVEYLGGLRWTTTESWKNVEKKRKKPTGANSRRTTLVLDLPCAPPPSPPAPRIGAIAFV